MNSSSLRQPLQLPPLARHRGQLAGDDLDLPSEGRLGVEFQSSTAQALDRRAQRAPPGNVRLGAPQAVAALRGAGTGDATVAALLWHATVAALRAAENSGSGDRVRSADQLRCVIVRGLTACGS